MARKNRANNNSSANRKNVPVSEREYSKLRKVVPRNEHQQQYLKAIEDKNLVIASGPAGSGKTYLAVYEALCHHWSKKAKLIIISSPAIESGEKLGFLPGDLEDKLDPYLRPIFDALYTIAGIDTVRDKIARGFIEIAPLAYMRGRTFNDCFVILDEAQNATLEQLKMAVTRIGGNCKMIVNGDPGQSDLIKKKDQGVGLCTLQDILKGINSIATIEFDKNDIVRDEIVIEIVSAFDKYEENND